MLLLKTMPLWRFLAINNGNQQEDVQLEVPTNKMNDNSAGELLTALINNCQIQNMVVKLYKKLIITFKTFLKNSGVDFLHHCLLGMRRGFTQLLFLWISGFVKSWINKEEIIDVKSIKDDNNIIDVYTLSDDDDF